jgi:GT2 family glycosyltransferase
MKQQTQVSKRLVAVIVTRNRLEHLKRSLGVLTRVSETDLTGVVVVDNASSDGTVEWLRAQDDPRVRAVLNSENKGGAGGFAQGMALAQKQFEPDWFVLLDDDAAPRQDAISNFHARNSGQSCVVVAAVYDHNGQICDLNRPFWSPFWSVRRLLRSVWTGRDGYYVSNRQFTSRRVREVDFATFVGFFVSKESVSKVGLPGSRFFLYCDDLEYCLRLRRAGFHVTLDPCIEFTHASSTFTGGRRVYAPVWKSYYAHRNGLIFIRKVAGVLAIPTSIGLIAVWAFRSLYYPHPVIYLSLLGLAVKDGLLGNFHRPHRDILSRAARGIGWKAISRQTPSAPKASDVKTTKPASS